MRERVAVNDFVRRQVPGSGKSYAVGVTFEAIAAHAAERMAAGHYRDGYRDGVRIVIADPAFARHFVCPLVKIDSDTHLTAEAVRRREGEEPYIRIRARNGTPLPVGRVELILYRHDVLAEDGEQSTDAEWELISFHAIPEGVDQLPMHPVTMMRNQLHLPGGTAAHYSSEEWAEAVRFWQHYAALEPEEGRSRVSGDK
jgi:hypothetical protein